MQLLGHIVGISQESKDRKNGHHNPYLNCSCSTCGKLVLKCFSLKTQLQSTHFSILLKSVWDK